MHLNWNWWTHTLRILHKTKFVLLQLLAELGLTHTSMIEMATAGKPCIIICSIVCRQYYNLWQLWLCLYTQYEKSFDFTLTITTKISQGTRLNVWHDWHKCTWSCSCLQHKQLHHSPDKCLYKANSHFLMLNLLEVGRKTGNSDWWWQNGTGSKCVKWARGCTPFKFTNEFYSQQPNLYM